MRTDGCSRRAGFSSRAGTLDVLDGEMARRRRRDGPRGAFMDSVVDRYGESAVFAGLVVFYRE